VTGFYNLLGLRTAVTASVPSQGYSSSQTRFAYDTDYQLTSASYPAGTLVGAENDSWTYNPIGTRHSATIAGSLQNYNYDQCGTGPFWQRLQNINTTLSSYVYDATGNTSSRTASGSTNYLQWDYANRLSCISTGQACGGTHIATYTYDYQGRRMTKTVPGSAATTYLYDNLNLVQESGGSAASYLFGPGTDEPLAMYRATTLYYYDIDGLGSVAAVNPAGSATPTNNYVYDAWGQVRAQNGSPANDFGYTGREFSEAGFHYYRARYYSPGIGRFESEDPVTSGPHEYEYVFSNPVNLTDPGGREACRILPPTPDVSPEPVPIPVGAAMGTVAGVATVAACEMFDPAPVGAGSELSDHFPDPFRKPNRKDCPTCRPKGKWTCIAQCNLQGIGSVNPLYPRVYAFGFGSSQTIACNNAKCAATQSAPRGTYGRHCICTDCWQQ
jgi:RHS repeat-associated protein